MTSQPTENLIKLPAVPKKFGDDGGKFYRYYDELADELDEDMVTSLKSQLDGILIFAGLFAGVNSAFLAFTLPQLSADPSDDTNALLFQIMRGANGTITSPADLPSASFSPPSGALRINILFSMSLTLALLASFLAVLGQQWLVYYRKRSGGGAERQRWEQLRRYLGAKRWRLELVLDDALPSLLQIGLVIFCVAFILYLGTLNKWLCYAIAAPLCVAGALVLAMAIFAAWDHWCPFKSPLSHLFQPIMQSTIEILGKTVALPASFMYTTFEWLQHKLNARDDPFAIPRNFLEPPSSDPLAVSLNEPADDDRTRVSGFKNIVWHQFLIFADWFKGHSKRSAQIEEQLQIIALKRVLCTSEDSNALIHAATNSRSIGNNPLIKQMLLDDDEFCRRLENLSLVPGLAHRFDDHHSVQDLVMITSWFSLVVSAGSVEDLFDPNIRASPESDISEEDYALRFMGGLSRKLGFLQLYFTPQSLAECPDLTGPHYAIAASCTAVVSAIASPDLLDTIGSYYDGRGEPRASWQDSTSWGYAWLEAWTIQLSKDWYDHRGKISVPDSSDPSCTWRLDKLRLFFQTYQKIGPLQVVQIICDAIATSAFQWDKRPHHGTYVALFERAMDITSDLNEFILCPTFILQAFTILLCAIENRIRHSATSIEEKQSERQYRRTCTEIFITVIRETYLPTGRIQGRLWFDMKRRDVTDVYSPLWYAYISSTFKLTGSKKSESPSSHRFHCTEASDSLQDHLQWIKDTIQSDPSNPENPPLMILSRTLRERLPPPDEVESGYQDGPIDCATPWKDKSTVQSYRPFYSAFEGTMAEIESILATAGPRPMQDVLPREDKTTRTDPEWW
ncbi:hypothetical protein FRC01_003150, partial [Tulasnella sp. 417]